MTHDEQSSTLEDVASPDGWSKIVDHSGAAGGLAHLPEPWARHRWADVEQVEGQAGPTSKEEPDREAESLRARRLSAGDVLVKLLKELEGNSAAAAAAQQQLAVVEAEGHAGPPSKEEVLGKWLKELDSGTAQQLLAVVEVQAAREADGVRPKGKAQWEKGPWDLGKATSSPEWRATAQPRGPKEPRWLCNRSTSTTGLAGPIACTAEGLSPGEQHGQQWWRLVAKATLAEPAARSEEPLMSWPGCLMAPVLDCRGRGPLQCWGWRSWPEGPLRSWPGCLVAPVLVVVGVLNPSASLPVVRHVPPGAPVRRGAAGGGIAQGLLRGGGALSVLMGPA